MLRISISRASSRISRCLYAKQLLEYYCKDLYYVAEQNVLSVSVKRLVVKPQPHFNMRQSPSILVRCLYAKQLLMWWSKTCYQYVKRLVVYRNTATTALQREMSNARTSITMLDDDCASLFPLIAFSKPSLQSAHKTKRSSLAIDLYYLHHAHLLPSLCLGRYGFRQPVPSATDYHRHQRQDSCLELVPRHTHQQHHRRLWSH